VPNWYPQDRWKQLASPGQAKMPGWVPQDGLQQWLQQMQSLSANLFWMVPQPGS
jgi:hypothetical protein